MKTMLVGNTHIVQGGAEKVPAVLALLKKEGIATIGNPDLYVRTYKHFGIDEARELREKASLRALNGRRIFVVLAPDINREAQNALLKTLEEPNESTLFFFILPSPESLLPTLRSRVQVITLNGDSGTTTDAKIFLSSSPEKRLDMLKPLLEKGDDEPGRSPKRDLGAMLAFLASLERQLEKSPEGLRAVYRSRKYITDKGALAKPLLEQVALLVPRMK